MLVFNNGRKRTGGAHSSVDELLLPVNGNGLYEHKQGTAYGPDQPIWSYTAQQKRDFKADEDWTFVVDSFNQLADKLGC